LQTAQDMQNVLPLTPGNPLRNITGLARQIALPGEHVPLRFPSFPALERTAVMGFNAPATLPVPTGTLTSLTVFRQATYPVWADQVGSLFYYTEVELESPGPATVGQTTLSAAPALRAWGTGGRPSSGSLGFSVAAAVAPNSYITPRWPLMAADVPGSEFTFVPRGCTWTVVVSNTAQSYTDLRGTVNLDVWSSPREITTFEKDFTAIINSRGLTTVPNPAPGVWLRVKSVSLLSADLASLDQDWTASLVVTNGAVTYVANPLAAGQVLVAAPTDVTMHLPLVSPSEFANSALPWFATRVTAAALLGTNVTQVLNKGGTVLAGRVSPAVQNAWTITSAYIEGLHPAEKAFLPLETGVYTYAPPSTDLIFFGDYTLNTAGGAPQAPIFRLDNDSLYNKIYLSPGSVAESMACTVTWHLEFRTSSSLFQIGLCAMTLESLHQAQLVLAESGFFFENPEHDKLLTRVINAAKKYAPAVVGAIDPRAALALKAVSAMQAARKSVKPRQGPGKPPTTTAAKSGIVGPPAKGNKKKGKKKR